MVSLSSSPESCSSFISSHSRHSNEDKTARIAKSVDVAEEANKLIAVGNYSAAMQLLTVAIELNANDYRFFVNRSFCYESLKVYDLALKDAEFAIKLNPKRSKCHYRRGKALIGLGLLEEAERSFFRVVALEDGDSKTTESQLLQLRIKALNDLGVDRQMAAFIAKNYKCINEIYANRDSILKIRPNDKRVVTFENNCEKDDNFEKQSIRVTNPFGWKGLQVSNLNPDVKLDSLRNIFSTFGELKRCEIFHSDDKVCCLIHYNNPESPRFAMAAYQGAVIKDVSLNDTQPLRILFRPNDEQKGDKFQKKLGGKECYYWRTTGCLLSTCKRLHVAENKGVDLQPWMQKSNSLQTFKVEP
ncbi:hypothetical protein B4U79_14447 [Dinothrombium tinctorium]|uniref:RRM domain-containing protein n=1 Tax=Dinothrombium tinctorium TaxID=1965070 RepID=A0A3S3Q8Y4_9ACAR|nr:hypothetical protein B4U79_16476 [Dinothrombium tinctorium]RWS04015.1 hypothetical protein B4U79_16458 [Dinothrombium tinctorium]RWS05507.1 hypothetical protein B4U79_14447 [Dinothrombium tinctorium]